MGALVRAATSGAFIVQIVDSEISGVKLIRPIGHMDRRGLFSEIYREDVLRRHGITVTFVQENHSRSSALGVIRGLHFQIPPAAQAKLLWVMAGAIFDVVVDIRHGSPSFGRHIASVLTAANGDQLFVPEGFAHGFCTLEPDTEVLYKVNRYYSPEHDRGLRWNDPALDIAWPVSEAAARLSERDRCHPVFAELPRYFDYSSAGCG
jgi:dTDP-4-dehydrorhamnose 3,5-epimerase